MQECRPEHGAQLDLQIVAGDVETEPAGTEGDQRIDEGVQPQAFGYAEVLNEADQESENGGLEGACVQGDEQQDEHHQGGPHVGYRDPVDPGGL